MNIDSTDLQILAALQPDGRLSNVELASRVHLSASACLRRVKALEESGVIQGYRASVDPASVGLPDNVFVSVGLASQDQADLDAFEEAVRGVPEVMECYLMTGDFDYLLRVVAAGAADYERIHRQHLTRLPSVARVHSSFALRVVEDSAALPLARGQRTSA
jgi:Lrp/AsnC family leucine-responsive transcriptional regulator